MKARHRCALDTQGHGPVKIVDATLIHTLAIVEVTRCRSKAGTRRSIALALETVAGSALALVEEGRGGEVRGMLGSNLDIVRADNLPIELTGKRGHL
jgi:hypothetical protein